MRKETRLDRGNLRKMHRTPEGYAYVEGYATRAGVFEYRDATGKLTRELRPPEEVGRADSVGTLARKPFTNEHPKGTMVTADNVDEFGVGCIDPEIIWESDFADGYIKIRGTIQNAKAVADVLNGKQELSCGYTCDVDDVGGTWIDHAGNAHEYDAIQRNIVYNHLAIVPKGRAGNLAALRVDAEQVEPQTTPQKVIEMIRIKIDGNEFDPAAEATATQRAINALEGQRNDAIAEAKQHAEDCAKAKADAAEANAKLDAATAELDVTKLELEKLKAEPKAPAKLDAAELIAFYNERSKLVERASKLGAKFDEAADNAAIKTAIVLTRFDADDLPTQAHVDAAFSLMSKDAEKADRADSNEVARNLLNAQHAAPESRLDASAKALADAQEAYEARLKA